MSKSLFLGFDTSNYTTSLAVVDAQANVVANVRHLLPVESGQRGLRQSEALFCHFKNLPHVMEHLIEQVPNLKHHLKAVAVTTSPRPQPESYMPVFLAGSSFATSLATLLKIPCYTLSHQENHLWAGLLSAKGPKTDHFLALHLSGGTSEILEVKLKADSRFAIDILGGSTDIHAGQFVDRVGVAMGLPFPAGADLEKLALTSHNTLAIPSYHKQGEISFSGAESAAQRMLAQGKNQADIAKAVLLNIARTVEKLISWATQTTKVKQVLLVGGVCANSLIRNQLSERLPQLQLYFAQPNLSVDNAVGAAVYGRNIFTERKQGDGQPK